MFKRILYIVIAIVIVAGLWYWYENRSDSLALDGGGVSSHDTLGSNAKSNMDRGVVQSRDLDNKPTTSDGYGGTVSYDNPPAAKAVTPAPAYTGTVSAGSASPQAVSQAPAVMPSQARVVQPIQTGDGSSPSTPASLPVADTLTPNAPNGMAFGGGGKFQWYRQGNLTWRINTQSGAACVAFATMDEWQKAIVYTHGCGNV